MQINETTKEKLDKVRVLLDPGRDSNVAEEAYRFTKQAHKFLGATDRENIPLENLEALVRTELKDFDETNEYKNFSLLDLYVSLMPLRRSEDKSNTEQ